MHKGFLVVSVVGKAVLIAVLAVLMLSGDRVGRPENRAARPSNGVFQVESRSIGTSVSWRDCSYTRFFRSAGRGLAQAHAPSRTEPFIRNRMFEFAPNIALRAYELWDAAGRPEGRSDEFYFQAEEEFRKQLEAEKEDTSDVRKTSVLSAPDDKGHGLS
jgi:hypothetical protein